MILGISYRKFLHRFTAVDEWLYVRRSRTLIPQHPRDVSMKTSHALRCGLIVFLYLISGNISRLVCRNGEGEVINDSSCSEERSCDLHASKRITAELLENGDAVRSERTIRYDISMMELSRLLDNAQPGQCTVKSLRISLKDGQAVGRNESCASSFVTLNEAASSTLHHGLLFTLNTCPPHMKFLWIVTNYPVHDIDAGSDVIIESRLYMDRTNSTLCVDCMDSEEYVIYVAPSAPVDIQIYNRTQLGASNVPVLVSDHHAARRFEVGRPLNEREVRQRIRTGALPHFIIIGAQKAGTTSLFQYISSHPMVRAQVKETHYFSFRFNEKLGDITLADILLMKSAGDCSIYNPCDSQLAQQQRRIREISLAHQMQYRRNFPSMADGHITGEATPLYLLYGDQVIPRMRAIIPDARLIVLLREPTQRAISAFRMAADYSIESGHPLSATWFGDTIMQEVKLLQEMGITADSSNKDFVRYLVALRNVSADINLPIVARGLYVLQLRLWLTYWPKEQLLIVPMSRIQLSGAPSGNNSDEEQHLQYTMDSIYAFLGLPPFQFADFDAAVYRAGSTKIHIADSDVEFLNNFYAPFNEALFQLLGGRSVW